MVILATGRHAACRALSTLSLSLDHEPAALIRNFAPRCLRDIEQHAVYDLSAGLGCIDSHGLHGCDQYLMRRERAPEIISLSFYRPRCDAIPY